MADYNSHGTHVAGIAAAADNGVGIVGANPQALIMPITVMQSDGSGDVRTIIKGIEYAVEHGATVINMSLGMAVYSQVLREALEHAYQTTILVAAAGNNGRVIYPEQNGEIIYPAAHSFVLGVMATKNDGQLAGFSNYDPDGSNFSTHKDAIDVEGVNYELSAPGVEILSTVPGGNYKKLSGTSMATPLVAGAISSLLMLKQYDNQEILWGDLLHGNNNFETIYNIEERPAEIDIISLTWVNDKGDEVQVDELNAGESYSVYPTIRSTWGEAHSVKFYLAVGEYEDASLIEIISNDVDFGYKLNPYSRGISKNPMVVKFSSDCADARHVRLVLTTTCDESTESIIQEFSAVVNNMVTFGGIIDKNTILTADHTYHVNVNIAVPQGVTLTIQPGTRLEFNEGLGIRSFGKLIANGTPEKPIVFTKYGESSWGGISSVQNGNYWKQDTLSYCVFENMGGDNYRFPYLKDCVLTNMEGGTWIYDVWKGERVNIINNSNRHPVNWQTGLILWGEGYKYSNFVNNYNSGGEQDVNSRSCPEWSGFHNNNLFNVGPGWAICVTSTSPELVKNDQPSYLGSALENIVRSHVWDIEQSYGQILQYVVFAKADLSNMLTEPVREAHGIVWKVVVNGYDAQDEYEQLSSLGVGKHKFDVYFNRPMNKAVTPKVSFGVRSPYTQHAVDENGSWNEEGTIYTVYTTITGKTQSDGVNRIYVYGAEDNEYFECPYENTRFNINIQAVGSLASGFVAKPGMGRVDLEWNNENNDFADGIGFNVYRIQDVEKMLPVLDEDGNEIWYWDENWNYLRKDSLQTVQDTIRVNQNAIDIEATTYTDYDVVPGKTYYYYYKVLSTDLKEFDVSNVVAATPLSSLMGDANGSGDVDVADVITTVGYITEQNPQPFIFEAADVNEDQQVDVIDVIGIVQKILNPDAQARAMIESSAVYTIEDGLLYVDSPVALAGVQVQLTLSEEAKVKSEIFTTAQDLNGFENASAWLSDNDYLFLAYSMSGKVLPTGKHALLYIGDAQVNTLRLGDTHGRNVMAVTGNTTTVSRMGSDVMNIKGIYTLEGQKLSGNAADLKKLPKGIYIINGQKVVK
ncbi:MAG: S8 family serine peptidase [Prevotella sp.]|nr:S8 family serine peptidase [Prevotella sp.]